MNEGQFPYRITALGDSALLVDYGNIVHEALNQQVISHFKQLQQDPLPGMLEAVPAYSSLTIYYDFLLLRKKVPADTTVYHWMKEKLQERLAQPVAPLSESGHLFSIPVWYDEAVAPDLTALCATNNISKEEMIALHTGRRYRVYMLGFLPGFAYLGQVDERIAMHRKSQPHRIQAGSVGIAGRQTGIYPLSSPGGWQIIGRTPLALFNSTDENNPTLLQAGNNLEFYPITKDEFESY